jgi:hypothetical protein
VRSWAGARLSGKRGAWTGAARWRLRSAVRYNVAMTVTRGALLTLEGIMAVAGCAGGAYGIAGAPGFPKGDLTETVFGANTSVPGLLLLVMVGLFMGGAFVLTLRRERDSLKVSLAAGATAIVWAVTEMVEGGLAVWVIAVCLAGGIAVAALAVVEMSRERAARHTPW